MCPVVRESCVGLQQRYRHEFDGSYIEGEEMKTGDTKNTPVCGILDEDDMKEPSYFQGISLRVSDNEVAPEYCESSGTI